MAEQSKYTPLGYTFSFDTSNLTRYEKARMIGSRALQISQGARPLIEFSTKELEELKYNPIEIAKKEFEKGVIQMNIKRQVPTIIQLQPEQGKE